MTAPVDPSVYTDFQGLTRLRAQARSQSPEALRTVARQFESLFMQMMLKSMRAASLSDGALDSDQSNFYRDMYDQQLAVNLSETSGLGLANVIVRQLGGKTAAADSSKTDPASITSQSRPVFKGAPFPLDAIPAPAQWTRPALPLAHGVAIAPAAQAQAGTSRLPVEIGGPQQFVQALWPQAREAAQTLGVAPEVLVAQAALETGWGRAVMQHPDGRSSHNLFGIKADPGWDGAQVAVPTLEYQDGVAVRSRAAFRAYDSFADSFRDYVDFLHSNPRYAQALQAHGTPAQFAAALQDAGYATDPDYALKINNIVNGDVLKDALAQLKTEAAEPLS